MSEMSNEARAILDAGRRAHDPSPRDKARVRDALRARIAAGDAPATDRPRPLRATIVFLAAALLLVMAIALTTRQPAVDAVPPPEVTASSPRAPAPSPPAPPPAPSPAPIVDPAPPQTPVVVAAPTPRERPRPTPSDADSLAEEIRILRQARAALGRNSPDDALRDVATHARRFPSGQLIEEREGLRVSALCLRERDAPAERALEEFARRFPRSPQLPRLRRACDPSAR